MASGSYNTVALTVRVPLVKKGMQQNLWQDSVTAVAALLAETFWLHGAKYTARNYSPEITSSVFTIHLGWFISLIIVIGTDLQALLIIIVKQRHYY